MITADSVFKVMQEHHMTEKGDRVVIGVSGGADSMCLLFLMYELKERLEISPEVIHINHGIRGESADKDEEYVREQCAKLNIPFKSYRFDIPSIAEKEGLSLEEAGRIMRYRAFREEKGDRIAVAHHAEDLAETLLFNLIRGTGIKGLAGIKPVSGDIIRPLLYFTRAEIEEYLKEKGVLFREDETNADISYARNRIRLNIIPEAERLNPSAVKHMLEAAEKSGEAWDFIEEEGEKLFDRETDLSHMPETLILNTVHISGAAGVLKKYVLKKSISLLAGMEKDITGRHVGDLEKLLSNVSGKALSLPYGIRVRKSFDTLIFSKNGTKEETVGDEIAFPVKEGEETKIILPGGERIKGYLTEKPEVIPIVTYTKWLDYDKIKDHAVWRRRRPGDRISIAGGSKKLKDYLIEERIPADERDSLYFLADEENVIWIPGLRIGHEYKVTGETKRVLRVSIETEP